MTPNYNGGNVAPRLESPTRVADEINIHPYVGGMLAIELISHHTNGCIDYPITENVYFDQGIVTAIEIHTEFAECRSHIEEGVSRDGESRIDKRIAPCRAVLPE
jgi:hypothetical protein